MMTDFKRSTEKVELKIHSDRTKILSNQRSNRQTEVKIDDIKIEVLPVSEKAQYLRQNHNVGAARNDRNKEPNPSSVGIIFGNRQELTSRSYLLRHRLRLFNMVITPTLTYGSGTWTLSHEHERMIRSTQRKMLRLLVQTKGRYKRKIKNKEVRTEK